MTENPRASITATEETLETDSANGDGNRRSITLESPELIRIHADPEHIWFDGTHLIEAHSRRAKPGKYYLTQVGETVLYRVEDIIKEEAHEQEIECPEEVDDVDDPVDLLVVQHCYTLSLDDEGPYPSGTQRLPRYQFETEVPLTMGDLPMRPFKQAVD